MSNGKRRGREDTELFRPSGGAPQLGSLVKIIRCGTDWAQGAYGIVTKMEPIPSFWGQDYILTVRATIHIGSSRERRRITTADVRCFARHVVVHQSIKEEIPDIDKEEEITEDMADALMRRGQER